MLNITKKSMRNYTYNAGYFGEWFRSSGVTITQLMKDLGVNNTSLKRWMIDKSNPLPVENMVLLCNIYDIDPHRHQQPMPSPKKNCCNSNSTTFRRCNASNKRHASGRNPCARTMSSASRNTKRWCATGCRP